MTTPNPEDQRWIDLAVAACAHANVEAGAVEIIATWEQLYCANAVYRIAGRRYLKLFGPNAAWQFHVERSVLRTLEANPSIPAPRIVAEAERADDRPYLILTEIPGWTAEAVWDAVPRSEQLAIARELGTITAAIHQLPQDDLADVERRHGGRRERADGELARLIPQIEATENVPMRQRDEMIRFLNEDVPGIFDVPQVVGHCELAHNHIYLSQETGEWKVVGYIDWADAAVGPAEWDTGFLWFWTFSRDREAMRECLRTFFADSKPTDRFARRSLAAILQTHSGPALWREFAESASGTDSIVRGMTTYLFPPDLFGPPI